MKRSLSPRTEADGFWVQMDGWMSRHRRCRVLSGRFECQLPLPAAPRPSTDRVASNALLTDAREGRTDLSFIRSHSLAICDGGRRLCPRLRGCGREELPPFQLKNAMRG